MPQEKYIIQIIWSLLHKRFMQKSLLIGFLSANPFLSIGEEQWYAYDLLLQRVSDISTISNEVFPYIRDIREEVTGNLLQNSVNM